MTELDLKTSPETAVFLDTSLPNIARIFDYLTGGTANFEADRSAAEVIQKVVPSLGKWLRLRRAFVQEATNQLYQAGFRQFLDLGSGMPSDDHIQAVAPDAHIIFSDINPVAVSYGQSIFEGQPHTAFVRADYNHLNRLFFSAEVRRLIHLTEPVAIGLNNLMLFMSKADIQQLAQALYAWAPVGSTLYVALQTRTENDPKNEYEAFQQSCRAAGLPIELYRFDHALDMMSPWQAAEILPLVDFLELPADFINEVDKTEADLSFYAGFFKKV